MNAVGMYSCSAASSQAWVVRRRSSNATENSIAGVEDSTVDLTWDKLSPSLSRAEIAITRTCWAAKFF